MEYNKKTKLLLLSITFEPEPGGNIRGVDFIKKLENTGEYDITVLTAYPWYPLGKIYEGYRIKLFGSWENLRGTKVLRVPLSPSHDRSAIKRLFTYFSFAFSALIIGLFRLKKQDVIYYYDNLPSTGFVAWIFSFFWKGKVVQHVADLWPETVIESGMLKKGKLSNIIVWCIDKWTRYLYKVQEHITVLSPGFKKILEAKGVPSEKITVIFNCADERLFYQIKKENKRTHFNAFELSKENFNVLYAGNIGPLQSLETVIDAAQILQKNKRINIHILLAGDGPSAEELKERSKTYGLINTTFLGRIALDKMNSLNAQADVLLINLRDRPFLHATVPSKTQVALACGKPIIISLKGDAPDLINKANAGFVIPPENSEELAKAIFRMSQLNKEKLCELGENGLAFYKWNLSLDQGVLETHELLTHILNKQIE